MSGDDLRLHAALHTTLYGGGTMRVVLPAALLRAGANRLTLVARDDGEVLRVENAEAIDRLDRMANGAGIVYQQLALTALAELPEELVALDPSVVYRRGADGVLRELCRLHVELAGAHDGGQVALEVPGERVELTLPAAAFGHVSVPFELADGEAAVDYVLAGALGERRGVLHRRRKWRVHVTPHAHTDIGYTHRQSEIGERHARNVDAALANAAPATYHVDSAWTLEEWLATRGPERLDALRRLAEERRFSVSGFYVDLLTHAASLEDLVRNELRALRLLEPLRIAPTFVSIVDVPSLSGALPALMEGAGLRYLVHASNQDRGPFRVNGKLDRSSPYWWEGTAGGRVLVWLSRMYCELRKVCGSPPVPSSAQRGLDLWLQEYERDDYPLDSVLLYGQEADNTDLDPQPLEFVRRWNDEYEWPQLVFSDVASFFEEAERAGDRLPVVRGDGGAYWEDGCGAAVVPTALARQAQADLPAAERLEALAAIHGETRVPADRFDAAWRDLLLWDEHTWGAFLSGPEPDAVLQRDQWEVKLQLAHQAASASRQLLHEAAVRHGLRFATGGREVVVHNPHSWPAGGAVTVEIAADEEIDVPSRAVSMSGSQQLVELWIDEVPAHGYRRFPLRRGAQARSSQSVDGLVLENEHYRLELDGERGCVRSLRDLELDAELVDGAAPWGFGSLVQALGGEGTRLVSNQADLPDGDPVLDASFDVHDVRCEHSELGSVLRVSGTELQVEWFLPARAKHVDVAYTWQKPERTAKEAAYVAFPTTLADAQVLSDAQLGWVRWGEDDLPGACKEWLPLQTAILVRGDGRDVLVCSPDVPLFCVGDVVRGRWPVQRDQRSGHVLSYVANNYWHTNYPARQGGTLRFRYRLTSAQEIDAPTAHRLGWEARRPLYAHRLSFQDFRHPAAPYADAATGVLASVEPEHVVLSALKPAEAGAGFVARFQEIAGHASAARLSLPGRPVRAAWRTDLVERDLGPLAVVDGSIEVDVPAWGLATVRFEL
jgi:hypothetical protein